MQYSRALDTILPGFWCILFIVIAYCLRQIAWVQLKHNGCTKSFGMILPRKSKYIDLISKHGIIFNAKQVL